MLNILTSWLAPNFMSHSYLPPPLPPSLPPSHLSPLPLLSFFNKGLVRNIFSFHAYLGYVSKMPRNERNESGSGGRSLWEAGEMIDILGEYLIYGKIIVLQLFKVF